MDVFLISPHQNPLNYQNIIRTATYKNIFQAFTPLKFLNYQNIAHTAASMDINGHVSSSHPTRM
jgi:hypothetical protein